jgi:exodeoxyribonuclease VII small subunit
MASLAQRLAPVIKQIEASDRISWETHWLEEQSMSSNLEKLTFEEAFGEMESTVQRLEEGDLTLDEALALYERGMRLARRCTDALDTAELQVQQVGVDSEQGQAGVFPEE